MVEENEILKKLIVEEKDITKELERQVEEASKHFRIEKPSGKIIFQEFGSLTDKQRVAVVLLGKYFAYQLKIIENPSFGISEVARELGRPVTALSGCMRELVSKGYVEYIPNGKKYRISYHRIKELFEDILAEKQRK